MKGQFVMIDGLDGSGKGVIATALRDYEQKKGKKILDLREYWEENAKIPEIEEVQEYDIIISSEPSSAMIGKVIREEIISKNTRKYSGLTTAHAFSLDREILYKKLLVPAMQQGKTIIQERGVITSLVYQPVQLEKITLMDIIRLPGNAFALKHAPSLLLITKIDPDIAMQRLKEREKQDNAIFEEVFFQRKIAARYNSDWLQKIFEKNKTRIEYIDTNPPKTIENTKDKAIEIWETHNRESTLMRHM
jgi:dTMP kinase